MFQSIVRADIGFGVIGELAFEGPLNAQPAIINSPDPTHNFFGRAFTHLAVEGEVRVGGTGVFAGILANPKEHANRGTLAGGTLADSLLLPNAITASFVQMTPGIIVTFAGVVANIGDWVVYDTTTGILAPMAPGGTPGAGTALVPNATVVRYEKTITPGLAVIALTGPMSAAAIPTP